MVRTTAIERGFLLGRLSSEGALTTAQIRKAFGCSTATAKRYARVARELAGRDAESTLQARRPRRISHVGGGDAESAGPIYALGVRVR